MSAASGIRAIVVKAVGRNLPQNTLNGQRPSLNTQNVLGRAGARNSVSSVCREMRRRKRRFRRRTQSSQSLCDSPILLPHLQLWRLIGNGIHYAQKSHLEVQEGMNPSERSPARRPQPLGRPAPRAARVQRAPGQTVHAIPLPQSRTVPKRNPTRISPTSSDEISLRKNLFQRHDWYNT